MKEIVVVLAIVLQVSSHDYRCSERFPLVTDFSQKNCPDKSYFEENHAFECFPGCYPVENDMSQEECNSAQRCPLGWKCPTGTNFPICEIDEDSCFKYHIKIDGLKNPYYDAKWKPECLNDGRWAPKQCKGELTNGRCFCYDGTGNRLFGQEWIPKATEMTCACSRRKAELMEEGKWYVGLHCDSMGNYEPLQCDSGQCWCAEPMTGKVISAVVTETLMEYLPCYNRTKTGEKYLRQCESQKYAQSKITHELEVHGTEYANFVKLLCDDDGSYGAYRIQNENVYCTWRDNTNLGTYQGTLGEFNKMNCNCARDTKIFSIAGLTMRQICAGNGNYQPLQRTSDLLYYCIDDDGYTKSEFSKDSLDCDKYA